MCVSFVTCHQLFRFDRTPQDVLQYTLQHSGWAKEHYQKDWDAQLPYYRTGPPSKAITTGTSKGSANSGSSRSSSSDANSAGANGKGETGAVESGGSIMLRVDILKEALPPSQFDFEVASTTSPTLVQVRAN